MTTDAEIIVKLKADSRRLQSDLDAATKKLRKFEKRNNTLAARIKQNYNDMSKASRNFNLALKATIGTLALRQVAQLSDAYTELTSRLRLVTDNNQQLVQAQQAVFDIAQRTRQPLGATAELYQRLAQSSEELRNNQSRLVRVTELVNKAIAAGGTSSESAKAAIIQLGQGLGSGALRGEELNSVIEQTPRLAQALAQGLGKTTGELKDLASQGVLTSETVIAALENQATAIESDYTRVGATIDQAFTTLENTFIKIIGGAGEASGAQSELTTAIMDFSKALNDPQIAEGIESIAVGAVTAFKEVAKAVSLVTNVTKFLADEISSELFGPAIDDAPRVAERMRELNDEIADLQKKLSNSNWAPGTKVLTEDLKAAQAELKKLKDARAAYLALSSGSSASGSSGGADAPASKNKKSSTSPLAIPEGVNKQYQTLLKNLQMQAQAQKDNSKEATVRFQIESGMLGKLNEQQKEMLITEAQRVDQAKEMASLSEEVKALRIESLSEEVKAVEELQEKYATLARAVDQGKLKPEEAAEIAKGLAENFEEQTKESKKAADEMSQYTISAARNMQSAFADFLFDPFEDGIEGMGKRFAEIIQRMVAEAAAAQIMNALGMGTGGNTQGAALQAIGGFFAGGFAKGGTIPAGQFGVVGENGPELAFSGNQPMHITPNHKLGGVTNSVTINIEGVRDSGDLKRTASQIARSASRAMQSARQ